MCGPRATLMSSRGALREKICVLEIPMNDPGAENPMWEQVGAYEWTGVSGRCNVLA